VSFLEETFDWVNQLERNILCIVGQKIILAVVDQIALEIDVLKMGAAPI